MPEEGGLPYDDLEWLLDSIPSQKKLMLIDACHSGELDKDEAITMNKYLDSTSWAGGKAKGLEVVSYSSERKIGLKNSFEVMNELFANVRRGTGATVLSAASGTQVAIEDAAHNNGYFMYSILELLCKSSAYSGLKVDKFKVGIINYLIN